MHQVAVAPVGRGRVPMHAEQATREVPGAIFFGPFFGEFGHELMWSGMCRYYGGGHSRVLVCSRPAMAPLYKDFASEFIPHPFRCEGVCAGATGKTRPSDAAILALCRPNVKRIPASMYRAGGPAKFFQYGVKKPEHAGAVVIHARSRGHVRMRNWAPDRWNRLARWLIDKVKVKRVICIGSKEAALPVEGALDMRGADLQEQMNVLASALCCIGPSSGPMHLAEHCGCPVLVWCGGGPHERHEVRLRYETTWNPFGAFAHAYEYASWQPTYETVYVWTHKFLEALCAHPNRNKS